MFRRRQSKLTEEQYVTIAQGLFDLAFDSEGQLAVVSASSKKVPEELAKTLLEQRAGRPPLLGTKIDREHPLVFLSALPQRRAQDELILVISQMIQAGELKLHRTGDFRTRDGNLPRFAITV